MEEVKKKSKKPEKMVTIYHDPKHEIQVKESLVDIHLKSGWRLKK